MAVVRNCNLPDDLYYNVENNVWCRKEADGTITVGMTAYACSLAGEIVAYTPKKAGKAIDKDKSVATVESGKWVGPVKAPVGGEILATNDAVAAKANTIPPACKRQAAGGDTASSRGGNQWACRTAISRSAATSTTARPSTASASESSTTPASSSPPSTATSTSSMPPPARRPRLPLTA